LSDDQFLRFIPPSPTFEITGKKKVGSQALVATNRQLEGLFPLFPLFEITGNKKVGSQALVVTSRR